MSGSVTIDIMSIIWGLAIVLLLVGILLTVQIMRFVKQLIATAEKTQETILKANDLIDQTNKMVTQATEITERVNNSYKHVNTVIDYATQGLANLVMSKIDKK